MGKVRTYVRNKWSNFTIDRQESCENFTIKCKAIWDKYIIGKELLHTIRKHPKTVTGYVVLIITVIILAFLPQYIGNDNTLSRRQRYITDIKYILYWTDDKLKRNFEEGQTTFFQYKCPYVNCYISYNRSFLIDERNFDAVVFRVRDIATVSQINLSRSEHQKYIFRSLELADKHPVCEPIFDNFFNLTWTYRLSSDIPHPYFEIRDFKDMMVAPKLFPKWGTTIENAVNFKSIIREKHKIVALYAKNCDIIIEHGALLDNLSRELEEHEIHLDFFGNCGAEKCDNKIDKCYKLIEKNYFFQLSIDDSLDHDYLPVKLIRTLKYVTVPIIYSNTNYSQFLPANSYLDLRVIGVKNIAQILKYLIENQEVYEFLLEWKKYYYIKSRPKTYVCDLCAKLNEDNQEKKTYSKFREWWNSDYLDACNKMARKRENEHILEQAAVSRNQIDTKTS